VREVWALWPVSKENLIERYGADARLPDIREQIAKCDRHGQWHDGCMVHYVDLKPKI